MKWRLGDAGLYRRDMLVMDRNVYNIIHMTCIG